MRTDQFLEKPFDGPTARGDAPRAVPSKQEVRVRH